jgi:hypothetical protein
MLEIFARPEDEALGKNAADLLGSAGAEYSALLERVVAAKTGSAISYKDHGHDHLLKLLPVLSDEGEVEWICAVVTEFRPAGHGR